MVWNVEELECGGDSLKLTQEYLCFSGQRLEMLVGRVFNRGQVKKISEVTAVVEKWTARAKAYAESSRTRVHDVRWIV